MRNQFELEDLLRASAEILGKGCLGTVYRAVLDDGCIIAVKRLKDVNPCERNEFEQYMDVVGKLKHPNIVRLRAYYYAKEEKLLVYDYLPNGNLHAFLHGSLLIGRSDAESDMLKGRVKQLCEAGLKAEYLSSSDLFKEEPDLLVDQDSAAAFLPVDCQLDAHRTVEYIEKANRNFASEGRYAEFYNDPVKCFIRSDGNGEVKAVQTFKNTLHSKKAVIVAAGCWTGGLIHDLFKNWGMELHVPVRPRKGHLLVLQNFNFLALNHGVMEADYLNHPTISGLESSDCEKDLSVSMVASIDTAGNLLLGSSREFVGFNTDLDESVVSYMWRRVGEFFPKLKTISLSDLNASTKVRIGLRPYMPDGKPVIGPVPGLSNVYLAAGHEGSGLSLALGTAEMIVEMVLGHQGKVDTTPFAVQQALG